MSLYIINRGTHSRPGTGLPFWSIEAKRGQQPQGEFLCLNNALIPFQIVLGDEPGVSFDLVASSGQVINLDADFLDIHCLDDNRKIFTYNGQDLGIEIPCGVYYIKITVDSGSYYSATLKVVNDEELIKIAWKDTKNWLGGIYYADGFNPFLYFKAPKLWRPRIQYFEELQENGEGDTCPVFQRSSEIFSTNILLAEYAIFLVNSIRHHDTIELKFSDTNVIHSIKKFKFTDNGTAKYYINSGTIEFEIEPLVSNCGEPPFTVIPCL